MTTIKLSALKQALADLGFPLETTASLVILGGSAFPEGRVSYATEGGTAIRQVPVEADIEAGA